MSFPFDPNAGAPAPAPVVPNTTHYAHHLAASIVLGTAYGGLTCKNREDGTPEWTLYFWCADGSSHGLVGTGNPMELVQQAGDTLAPHRGDKVFQSLQELAAEDPVSLLMVYEETNRALLSMIPINGHPTTWLPEHGWLLPEGMANVERGDDCSEDGEGFTLDPKEAVTAWWAFFAGKRSENERLKGTIQLMERSERRLSREGEQLRAAQHEREVQAAAEGDTIRELRALCTGLEAKIRTQMVPVWMPWTQEGNTLKTRLMAGVYCVCQAWIHVVPGGFNGQYSSAEQSGTVYLAGEIGVTVERLNANLSRLNFPALTAPTIPPPAEKDP